MPHAAIASLAPLLGALCLAGCHLLVSHSPPQPTASDARSAERERHDLARDAGVDRRALDGARDQVKPDAKLDAGPPDARKPDAKKADATKSPDAKKPDAKPLDSSKPDVKLKPDACSATGCACASSSECDDKDPCTIDLCIGACSHPPALLGTKCDADKNTCTLESCDGAGKCTWQGGEAPTGTSCDDGQWCTIQDQCLVGGICAGNARTAYSAAPEHTSCMIQAGAASSCQVTCDEVNDVCVLGTQPDGLSCQIPGAPPKYGVCLADGTCCTGCISPTDGTCHAGTSFAACGNYGLECFPCMGTQTCANGYCQ